MGVGLASPRAASPRPHPSRPPLRTGADAADGVSDSAALAAGVSAAGSGVSGPKLTCGNGSVPSRLAPPSGTTGVWGVWRSDVVTGTVSGAPKAPSAALSERYASEPPPAGIGVCRLCASSPPTAPQARTLPGVTSRCWPR
eukprot:scaffold27437_cov63-Phaeocystis_antarctica.AAC.3